MKFRVGDVVSVKKYHNEYDPTIWISRDGSKDNNFELIEVTIVAESEKHQTYLVDVTSYGTSYNTFKNSGYLKICISDYCIHPKNLNDNRKYVTIYESGVIELIKSVDKIDSK